jgi:hypothetical protein
MAKPLYAFSVALWAACTSAWGDVSGAQPAPGDRALLVGIDEYEVPKLRLRGSTADVANMKRLLIDEMGFRPEDVLTLTNAEASRARILAAFDNWLIGGSLPGSRVLFYYSGHGYYQTDLDGDEDDGFDEAIVPYDAIPTDTTTNPVKISNLIIDDEINDRLKQLDDRQVEVFLDSCFSGSATRNFESHGPPSDMVRGLGYVFGSDTPTTVTIRAIKPRDGGFITRGDQAVVWSAVSSDQFALVDRDSTAPQGVFTGRLTQELTRAASSKSGITIGALLTLMRQDSTAYCQSHPRDCTKGLSPQLEGPPGVLELNALTGRKLGHPILDLADQSFGTAEGIKPNGVDVLLRPGSTMKVGDRVDFRIRAERAGRLLVIDVNPEGQVTQLFPNKPAEDHGESDVVSPGDEVLIPDNAYGFDFQAAPPAGSGAIYALIIDEGLDLQPLLRAHVDLNPIADGSAYLTQLGAKLRVISQGEPAQNAVKLSVIKVNYTINP